MTQSLIVLASSSPRRRELLGLLGLPFTICSTGVPEDVQDEEDAAEMVQRLSRAKAEAARRQLSTEYAGHEPTDCPAYRFILAADTTVVLDGQMLAKPGQADEARSMLEGLRNREHQVLTGLTVVDREIDLIFTDCAQTRVMMRNYSDEEIAAYIASGDPFDKAGAYGIQHPIFQPVARLEGCYTNVVGLPLCHIVRIWRHLGIQLPIEVPTNYRTFAGHRCLACEYVLAEPAPKPDGPSGSVGGA